MDSLERLGHSLEQVISLIHALKRENRELAEAASKAAALALKEKEAEELGSRLADARAEIERLRQEPSPDLEIVARARAAELETASMAEQLDRERAERRDERQRLQARLDDMELQRLAAERDETM